MRIKFDEKMLVAQDLSAIGNLSLAVAIPILQVQKIPLAILPTSLLSTQSEGLAHLQSVIATPLSKQLLRIGKHKMLILQQR